MEKRYAAGGIVVKGAGDDIRVLLIKDIYGHWTWPKGHSEEGESSRDTALREITEETGLTDIEILEAVGRQEYFYTLGDIEVQKIVDIFLVRASEDGILTAQPEEVRDIKWFSGEEAVEKIEYEGSKEILEKGIKAFYEKY